MSSSHLLFVLLSAWIAPVWTDIKIHSNGSIILIKSLEASFGEELPFEGLLGRLIKGSPLDGCHPLSKAPPRTLSDPVWFVLLERSSNCLFEDKVSYATQGNYSGAIIYNNEPGGIIHMGGGKPDLVPSVGIRQLDGVLLGNNYTYEVNSNATLVIFPDEPFDLNVYLLPFAIVIGICFLLMLGIVLFKCVQDHRRAMRYRLPKSALKNLPVIKYVKESSPYDTCCICLDDYLSGDKLRILPCDHAYHKACIDPWLVKNRRVCPQCRKNVFGGDSLSNASSQEDEDSGAEDRQPDEWDSLLRNARSSLRNAGTFQAGGTYAAARADQLSSRTQSFRDRFSHLLRYRRMTDDHEEEEVPGYIDDQSTLPPSEEAETPGETLHVAIVHSVDPEEAVQA